MLFKKTRHMPQAGRYSTSNCQFLVVAPEIACFIFHRNIKVLEQNIQFFHLYAFTPFLEGVLIGGLNFPDFG